MLGCISVIGRMLHARRTVNPVFRGSHRLGKNTSFLLSERRMAKIYIPPAGPQWLLQFALVIADYAAASFIAGGLIALSLTRLAFDWYGL